MGVIGPGSTIGILGGGQLGRMTAQAASRLGYRCHIFSPDTDGPAKQVTPYFTTASYDDADALRCFAAAVDVVTYEFENIPAAATSLLASLKPLRPGTLLLEIGQDRLKEKDFLTKIGVPVTPYRRIEKPADLKVALSEIGPRGIMKTVRLGYDGKGQVSVEANSDMAALWTQLQTDLAVLEARVDFACEVSVIIARGLDGKMALYPAVENRHVNHILDTTIAPADVPAAVSAEAARIARHIAEKVELVGLLAVEMFVARDGKVLVNELAPRPHNSGHWTIDACLTSQFEQFVRAVVGLPLGSTDRHSDAVMKNLIGDEVNLWRDAAAEPGAFIHLYGKGNPRPGRKMGHITRLKPKS